MMYEAVTAKKIPAAIVVFEGECLTVQIYMSLDC